MPLKKETPFPLRKGNPLKRKTFQGKRKLFIWPITPFSRQFLRGSGSGNLERVSYVTNFLKNNIFGLFIFVFRDINNFLADWCKKIFSCHSYMKLEWCGLYDPDNLINYHRGRVSRVADTELILWPHTSIRLPGSTPAVNCISSATARLSRTSLSSL